MDGKRRLPPWMLDASKSEQRDEKNLSSREVLPVGKTLNKEKECLEADSSLLVTCGEEEGTRKLRRNEGGKNSIEGDLQKEKKRSNAKKRIEGLGKAAAPRKRRKLISKELDNGEEKKALSSNEEDEELTMEDLMSIAEEYVEKANNKKEAQHQKDATTAGPKSNKQLSATSLFFRNESQSGVTSEGAQGSEVPGTTTIFKSLPNFNSSKLKEQEAILKGGQETCREEDVCIGVNQRRTGDPTQDMLDLFLGPLLKKPQVEERKLEVMEPDITLASEFSENRVLQEMVVPLATKKKSSLKDKVTMFLG